MEPYLELYRSFESTALSWLFCDREATKRLMQEEGFLAEFRGGKGDEWWWPGKGSWTGQYLATHTRTHYMHLQEGSTMYVTDHSLRSYCKRRDEKFVPSPSGTLFVRGGSGEILLRMAKGEFEWVSVDVRSKEVVVCFFGTGTQMRVRFVNG